MLYMIPDGSKKTKRATMNTQQYMQRAGHVAESNYVRRHLENKDRREGNRGDELDDTGRAHGGLLMSSDIRPIILELIPF